MPLPSEKGTPQLVFRAQWQVFKAQLTGFNSSVNRCEHLAQGLAAIVPEVRTPSSGNKYFSFLKLHENYYRKSSGRDLCVAIFLASVLKEKYLFPDFI